MTRPDFNLLDFSSIQNTNENGEVTTDTSGVSVGLDAVKRTVTNHPDNLDYINRRIDGYNKTRMVEYYRECVEIDERNETIQEQRNAITETNANLEEGQEPIELPEYEQFKVTPVALTYEQLASMSEFSEIFRTNDKLNAFTFNGVMCSVCESDQNGWGSITTLLDLDASLGGEYEPVNFKNENGNTVTLATRDEWNAFVFAAATKRKEFF